MGPSTGADGGHRSGVPAARDAHLAAAGEADHDRPDVPLRPPAGGSLPPVLAVRRRGDRRPGAGDRRRGHRARDAGLSRRRARGRGGPPQLDRRRDLPAGLRRRADGLLRGPSVGATAARTQPARPERAATARFEGPGDGRPERRGAEDHRPAVPGVRGALRIGPGAPRRARRAVPVGAGARPRPRLLHADRIRVLRGRSRRPAAGHRRRWQVRRPGRAAGWPADSRDRLRDRPRPPGAGAG